MLQIEVPADALDGFRAKSDLAGLGKIG